MIDINDHNNHAHYQMVARELNELSVLAQKSPSHFAELVPGNRSEHDMAMDKVLDDLRAESTRTQKLEQQLAFKVAKFRRKARLKRRGDEPMLDYTHRYLAKVAGLYTEIEQLWRELDEIKSRPPIPFAARMCAHQIGFDLSPFEHPGPAVDAPHIFAAMRDWARNNHCEEIVEIDDRYRRIDESIDETEREYEHQRKPVPEDAWYKGLDG